MQSDRLQLHAAAFESAYVGLLVVDRRGWSANASFAKLMALHSRSGEDLISLGSQSGSTAVRQMAADLLDGSDPQPAVISIATTHAEQIMVRLRPMAQGGPDGGLIQAEDVTEQWRADEARTQLHAELERSNADLLAFATIAAHDLQEPVRKIRAFADRISPALAGEETATEADYLVRLQNSAIRMQTMLDDLLTFARVRVEQIDARPVDLGVLLEDLRVALDEKLEHARGKLSVEADLPLVLGDASQLMRLFENLILNSLKFVARDRPPTVSISCARQTPSRVCIDVVDNGIGFEPEHAELIFEPFGRLHSRSDFPGSGVGLALCRRIVERLGGRISAVGNPGLGATFSIELSRPSTG